MASSERNREPIGDGEPDSLGSPHPALPQRGREIQEGWVIAPSLAEETRAAYFANTPVL